MDSLSFSNLSVAAIRATKTREGTTEAFLCRHYILSMSQLTVTRLHYYAWLFCRRPPLVLRGRLDWVHCQYRVSPPLGSSPVILLSICDFIVSLVLHLRRRKFE